MKCEVCGYIMKPWFDLLGNLKVYQCLNCSTEYDVETQEWIT